VHANIGHSPAPVLHRHRRTCLLCDPPHHAASSLPQRHQPAAPARLADHVALRRCQLADLTVSASSVLRLPLPGPLQSCWRSRLVPMWRTLASGGRCCILSLETSNVLASVATETTLQKAIRGTRGCCPGDVYDLCARAQRAPPARHPLAATAQQATSSAATGGAQRDGAAARGGGYLQVIRFYINIRKARFIR